MLKVYVVIAPFVLLKGVIDTLENSVDLLIVNLAILDDPY